LLWLRPLDVPRFLSARTYAAPGSVVIEVVDPLELSGGRFALEGGPEGAACHETTKEADLALGISALGAISLGGHNLRVLASARLIEERAPGAIELANNMFRSSVAPWCSTFF
jgi:predicted acetyltransferase